MKFFLISTICIFCSQTFSQNVINCDSINKGIKDTSLYHTLDNGKVILRINLNKNKIFLIRNKSTNYYYYVTKKTMKKIKKCKCENIVIEEIPSKSSHYTPKIVRD
jgi:hypothetical protein